MAAIVESLRTDPRYPVGRFQSPEIVTHEHRSAAIADLLELPGRLNAAVDGLDAEQLNTPYRDGGWTVRQVVHHVADSHMTTFLRVKLALTDDWPAIVPRRWDEWAMLDDSNASVELSLGIVKGLQPRWVKLLQSLNEEQWQRGFRHPEKGRMTIESVTLRYGWHSRHHVGHITQLSLNESQRKSE
jgi:hypothetical protein